jgi:hypothetical protein
MSETAKNQQGKKPKISKLAIASVSVGAVGFCVILLRAIVYRPWWNEFVWRNIVGLSGIAGLIFGVVARRNIVISPRRRTENYFTIIAILLGALLTFCWWHETCGHLSTASGIACRSNLTQLRKAILIYGRENGQYPHPNQWCDLLVKHVGVDAERFVCPAVTIRWRRQVFPWPIPRKTRCHYAMNPNCRPNSPPDTVLLFETKGGWNRSGGPELLTTENHKAEGCSVLFNDGHVEFVKNDRLGQLKWKVGEDANRGADKKP